MRRRFHLPASVKWPAEAPGLERPVLDQAILSAVTRAIEQAGRAGGEIVPSSEIVALPQERFEARRFDGARATYRIPSFDGGGEPTEVAVRSAADHATRFGADTVYTGASPLEGRLLVILPHWRAVNVRSHRYAVTSNLVHALAWGEVLFGAGSFAILENLRTRELITLGTDEAVRWDELRTRPAGDVEGQAIFGGEGRYHWMSDIADAHGQSHRLRTLVTVEGHVTFPPERAVAREYFQQLRRDRRRSERLDAAAVRRFVFDEIDRLIAEEEIEEAAERLAGLDASAFGLLPFTDKARYLRVLIEAWTWEEQERAIVEVFKSMRSVTEVRGALDLLRAAGRYGDLFDDLDSQLWSLLSTVGSLDPRPFTVREVFDLLLEAGLVPGLPTIAARITVGPAGPVVDQYLLDEAEEAANSFVRFLGGTVEGLWMFLSHPEKVVEGVGQLVRLSVTMQLAQWGHRPSQQLLESMVQQAARQVAAAVRGAQIMGAVDRVARRVKWAAIWEVASLFIGVGEVKAVLSSVRVSELTLVLTRAARILGFVGEAAEGSRAVRNLERLAAAVARAHPPLGATENLLQLMTRLPEDDLRRLARLLEAVDLEEGIDLARLAAAHPELAEAAADVTARTEALAALAAKAGGLTDDVAEAFARLAGSGLSPVEIRSLVDGLPSQQASRFLATLRRVPSAAVAGDQRELLTLLARSPRAMDAVVNEGFGVVSALHRRSGRGAERFEEYLSALGRLRDGLPADRRAVEYRRLLDGLEADDIAAWTRLESSRRVGARQPALGDLAATVGGDARAQAGFARLLRGRHDALLDDLVEDILPHDPPLVRNLLGEIGGFSDEQTRGLSILHELNPDLPGATTWGDVLSLPAADQRELLELIARVHPSLDDTEGLARALGRALTGPGTNLQGTMGHLWAARTLQRRFPGARMRFEVQIPGRELDIRLTTGGRAIDVEVKSLLTPAPNPGQIRRDLIRHLDDRFEDLLYLFEPGGGSLDPVRNGMREALGHPEVAAALGARGIDPTAARQWLQQRLAGDLVGFYEFQ